jgi:hypothetical protein
VGRRCGVCEQREATRAVLAPRWSYNPQRGRALCTGRASGAAGCVVRRQDRQEQRGEGHERRVAVALTDRETLFIESIYIYRAGVGVVEARVLQSVERQLPRES